MTDILPNIPRGFTALAEWLACLIFILPILKNHSATYWPVKLFLMGIVQYLLQLMVSGWPLIFWIPGMMLNIFWMFLTFLVVCKISLKYACYLCCKAFIIAEFTASLVWQLYCQFLLNGVKISFPITAVLIGISYLILFLIFYLLEKKKGHAALITDTRKKDVMIGICTAGIIFTISNIGFMSVPTLFLSNDLLAIFFIRTLVNLSGICILYMQENQKSEDYLKKELIAINNIFQLQYEQYLAYKESSSMINQKFHDLKHQIDTIRSESDSQKKEQYLDEMSEAIHTFSANIYTGNGILDTILTRKNAACINQQITFTCIVDGALLSFIETMDICSLFGNALDNAIESVLKIEDVEKRLINLRVFKSENFIMILVENYCLESLYFEEGMLQTTKENKNYHGYGLKSISYVADKYNGNMTIDLKDNWFHLKVLLPITE